MCVRLCMRMDAVPDRRLASLTMCVCLRVSGSGISHRWKVVDCTKQVATALCQQRVSTPAPTPVPPPSGNCPDGYAHTYASNHTYDPGYDSDFRTNP